VDCLPLALIKSECDDVHSIAAEKSLIMNLKQNFGRKSFFVKRNSVGVYSEEEGG
jgi:hypothetical protein